MASDRAYVRLGNVVHLIKLDYFPAGLVSILSRHIAICQDQLVRVFASIFLDMPLNLLNTVLSIDSAVELVDHPFSTVVQQNLDSVNIEQLVIYYQNFRDSLLQLLNISLFDQLDLLKPLLVLIFRRLRGYRLILTFLHLPFRHRQRRFVLFNIIIVLLYEKLLLIDRRG